jgi:hypothetical protein
MDRRATIGAPSAEGAFSQFAIGVDPRDRERVLEIWDSILSGSQWSEGEWTARFEEAWSAWNGLGAVAFSGWTGAALAALEFAGVRGETVLCPPRRSRPARAACSSRATTTCSSTRAPSATTASPSTGWRA